MPLHAALLKHCTLASAWVSGVPVAPEGWPGLSAKKPKRYLLRVVVKHVRQERSWFATVSCLSLTKHQLCASLCAGAVSV